MPRRGTLYIAVISTLFLLTAAAMWVRSYAVIDRFSHRWTTWRANGQPRAIYTQAMIFHRGDIRVSHYRLEVDDDGDVTVACIRRATTPDELNDGWGWHRDTPYAFGPYTPLSRRLGFSLGGYDTASGSSSDANLHYAGVPIWLLMILFAIAPARLAFARFRHPTGHCRTCGYDLRATPDRCPECGTMPTEAAA